MKYLFISILAALSLAVFANETIDYEIGNELKLKRDNSQVLYHYKHDAIELSLNRDFLDSPYRLFIDARDLYRVKKGEKIKLLESFRDGRIFKVELLEEQPKRDYYFVELESLKNYLLILPETSSG